MAEPQMTVPIHCHNFPTLIFGNFVKGKTKTKASSSSTLFFPLLLNTQDLLIQCLIKPVLQSRHSFGSFTVTELV